MCLFWSWQTWANVLMSFKKRNVQKNHQVFVMTQLAPTTQPYSCWEKLLSRKCRADMNIDKVESNWLGKRLGNRFETQGVALESFCLLRLHYFLELRVLRRWLDSLASQKLHKSPQKYLFSWKSLLWIHSLLLSFSCKSSSATLGSEASPITAKHQRLGTAQRQSNNKQVANCSPKQCTTKLQIMPSLLKIIKKKKINLSRWLIRQTKSSISSECYPGGIAPLVGSLLEPAAWCREGGEQAGAGCPGTASCWPEMTWGCTASSGIQIIAVSVQ